MQISHLCVQNLFKGIKLSKSSVAWASSIDLGIFWQETDRQADRQAGRQAGRLAGRQAGRQAGRLAGWLTNSFTDNLLIRERF
jgi:hypothetical protein